MLITDNPVELAVELESLVARAWAADRDTSPSPDAKERAKQATYELAGLVMHNAAVFIAALYSVAGGVPPANNLDVSGDKSQNTSVNPPAGVVVMYPCPVCNETLVLRQSGPLPGCPQGILTAICPTDPTHNFGGPSATAEESHE